MVDLAQSGEPLKGTGPFLKEEVKGERVRVLRSGATRSDWKGAFGS